MPLALAALLLFDSTVGDDRLEAESPPPTVAVPWPPPLHSTAYERASLEVESQRWPAPLHSTAYERARLRGQPIALLTRDTAIRATPGGQRIGSLPERTEVGTRRWLAVVGKRGRWLRVIATELPNGRTGWIREGSARLDSSPWAVRADISRRHAEVLKDGRVVRSFTVGIGTPSTPTLPGRFGVTDKVRFGGGTLAYGCCVLALTGHLPHPGNGSRMAIHGTSAPGSIGGAASFGCLRAGEADMRWLLRRVSIGSVVEIRR